MRLLDRPRQRMVALLLGHCEWMMRLLPPGVYCAGFVVHATTNWKTPVVEWVALGHQVSMPPWVETGRVVQQAQRQVLTQRLKTVPVGACETLLGSVMMMIVGMRKAVKRQAA